MKFTSKKNLSKLEAIAPPVSPAEARRRSLLNALFGAINDEDVDAIARKQVEQAKAGDAKSARLVIDLIQAQPATFQQAIVIEQPGGSGVLLSEVRENVARLIESEGPQQAPAIAGKMHASLEKVLLALNDHEWFEKTAEGWQLTRQGRREAVPLRLPARSDE